MTNHESVVAALELSQFNLAEFDKIKIKAPQKPQVVEEDIDAQLFEYVASAWRGEDKKMNKLADLDDEWVRDKFPSVSTIAGLRQTIREDLEKRAEDALQEFKIQACSRELVAKVEGEVSQELIDANIEPVRGEYLQQLASSGSTLPKYLQREGITTDEFERKLREDVAYRIKLNIALDLLVEKLGVSVDDDHLTDYLWSEDPGAFLAEVRDRGMIEDARKAASRIKAMREIVEGAEVTFEA